MIIITPDFYDDFVCTASRCSDNCCIGWEIDIDAPHAAMYRQSKGKLADDFFKYVSSDNPPHFVLGRDERCPFLNKDNLCRIIPELGEEGLCDICREHPRFYEWYNDRTEAGLGLCCEEVCRLLLASDKSIVFNERETPTLPDVQDAVDEELCRSITATRAKIFEIAAERRVSLKKRIINCIEETAENNGQSKDATDVKNVLNEIIGLCSETEPFDKRWNIICKSLEECDINVFAKRFTSYIGSRDYEYEKLFVYLVYRHFIKAIYDGNADGHLRFCVLLLIIFRLCDICEFANSNSFTPQEHIDSLKYLSKQFEYSEENLDLVLTEISQNEIFSYANLKALTELIF